MALSVGEVGVVVEVVSERWVSWVVRGSGGGILVLCCLWGV